MNAPFVVSTVLIGQLLIGGPLTTQSAGPGMATAELHRLTPDIMLIQAAPPLEAATDRMMRLRQNRAILENALRAPHQPPQAPLQEPMPAAPPADVQPEQAQPEQGQPEQGQPEQGQPEQGQPEQELTAETQAPVSCEAAAAIVADYGFSDIQATDCAGELYRFSATRDGTAYSIGITAATGEIAEVNRQ
jgi:hypothetical protein